MVLVLVLVNSIIDIAMELACTLGVWGLLWCLACIYYLWGEVKRLEKKVVSLKRDRNKAIMSMMEKASELTVKLLRGQTNRVKTRVMALFLIPLGVHMSELRDIEVYLAQRLPEVSGN